MENIDDYILSLTSKEAAKKQAEELRQSTANSLNSKKIRTQKYVSDSEDEGAFSDDEVAVDEDDDMEDIDEYGPDLYKDEEDRRNLQALPEVERERILAERSEERQRNLERLEVRKLLKDGRREDATRRSTRAKGSGTSRALSELTRRREEKNKVRSKRHRRDSPSPDRKKFRKYGENSDYDYSQEEYEGSEDETEKKAKKRTPQLEEIQSVCMTRSMIEKWLFAPFFDNTIIGSFVRLFIGPDPVKKVPVYRICQVTDVVPWHKKYKIGENTWCNKALKVKHGKAEKDFPMDIISNQPVTQQEYARYLTTLETDRVRILSIDQIEQKAADFKSAREYTLNDKEVNEMIEKKKSVKGSSVNVAMEKAELLARLEHAKGYNETDEVIKISKLLKELDEKSSQADGGQLNIWNDINNRNRAKDRSEVHEAELRMIAQRRQQQHHKKDTTEDITTTAVKQPKPLFKLATISKAAIDIGEATSHQTEYERLVSRVSKQVKIRLLDE